VEITVLIRFLSTIQSVTYKKFTSLENSLSPGKIINIREFENKVVVITGGTALNCHRWRNERIAFSEV